MTGSASIEEKEIAEKLVSVCATLDEYPVIQYQNSERCSNIAKHLQDRLDSIKKTSDEYAKKSRSQEASILLILDRTFDPLSPLLHEFTYQAMCYDLLSLPGNHFSYTSETVKGEQRQKKVLLSEKDPLWRDFRHTHIADINNTLSDDFNRFLAKHQPSKFQQTNNLGIGQMSAAIKALPQFTEELSRYTCHIELSTQCNTEFKTQQLKDIGPIEQLMATGEDDEGKTVKNLIPLLSPLLEDEKISLENKLRLFMLYIISQEGIKESNRNKLLEICRFDTKDTFAVTNLKYLGVSLEKGPTRSKKKAERNSEYNLSRYIPPLKIIGSSLISGEVLKDFKYVRKEDAKRFIPTNLNQESDVKSRRSNHQAKWGKKEKKEKEVLEKEKKTAELKGGRVMIFVAGGISFSEIRVAYELSAKFKREVILGGTEILTPKSYIENIRLLKTTIGE